MNPYYSGLGIARSLHGRGIPVFALTAERGVPGARSRYFEDVYVVPNGRDEPERLCQRLLESRADPAQRPIIFPTRDFDVLFLDKYRTALARDYLLPQPEGSVALRMLDKLELATVATRLNIPTPATVICGSTQDLERHIARLRFPVVIKPRFAYEWRRKGVWDRVGAQKAIVVQSSAELRSRYEHLASVSRDVLLQEYVSGRDSDIVVCCCYTDRHGELLGHFTARKLRQNPPLIGTGCVVEASEIGPIVAPSVQLLRAFGYSGLAEIEYKYDEARDAYYLIEINPRHWDQHELGNLVGTNLTWIAYQDIIGLPAAKITPSYGHGVKHWIAETELVEGIARNVSLELAALRASKASYRDYLSLFRGTYRELAGWLKAEKVFGILKLRDPIPGFLMFSGLVAKAFGLFGAMVRRRVRPADNAGEKVH